MLAQVLTLLLEFSEAVVSPLYSSYAQEACRVAVSEVKSAPGGIYRCTPAVCPPRLGWVGLAWVGLACLTSTSRFGCFLVRCVALRWLCRSAQRRVKVFLSLMMMGVRPV